MRAAILSAESESDFNLIMELSKKLKLNTQILTDEELQDLGLYKAMKSERTYEYVDTDSFVENMRK
ncbi:MAG: hypothetical protein ABSG15_12430 [FCB group bacterium]|jgi:cobalamin biosynthesis protein CbiG